MNAAVGDTQDEGEDVASVDCERGEHDECGDGDEYYRDVAGDAHIVQQPADVIHAAERENDNRGCAEVRRAAIEVDG